MTMVTRECGVCGREYEKSVRAVIETIRRAQKKGKEPIHCCSHKCVAQLPRPNRRKNKEKKEMLAKSVGNCLQKGIIDWADLFDQK